MQKYEIKGIVGEGAYGIVYQAKVKETGEIGKNPHHFTFKSGCKLVSKAMTYSKSWTMQQWLRRFVIWSSYVKFQTVTQKLVHNR